MTILQNAKIGVEFVFKFLSPQTIGPQKTDCEL